jgi:hypothetical protein
MKKILFIAMLIFALPAISEEEKLMLNSNPSPDPNPTLGHHMQNRTAFPEEKPVHSMENSNPNQAGANAAKKSESSEKPVDIQHLNK